MPYKFFLDAIQCSACLRGWQTSSVNDLTENWPPVRTTSSYIAMHAKRPLSLSRLALSWFWPEKYLLS